MQPIIPKIGLIQTSDVSQLVQLLGEMEVPIAGYKAEKLYRIFCREALVNSDLIVVTAKTGNDQVVGFNISIINRGRFWKVFALKHPISIAKIILKKMCDNIRVKRKQEKSRYVEYENIKKYLSTDIESIRWQDSSNEIAKIIYTGVHPDYQKMNIGTQIVQYRNAILVQKGVKRLDSTVSPQNIASIKLNYKMGAKLIPQKEYLLACNYLNADSKNGIKS